MTHRRWASLIVAVAALAVVAIPVASMQTSLNQRPAAGSSAAAADEIVSDRFGAGFTGPLLVLVDGPDAATRATAVHDQMAALSDVAFVAPPRINPQGSAALITVIPTSGPDAAATIDLVKAIRDTVADTDGAKVYVTGTTAVSIDVSQKLERGPADLPGAGSRPRVRPADAGLPLGPGARPGRARLPADHRRRRSAPPPRSSSGVGSPPW